MLSGIPGYGYPGGWYTAAGKTGGFISPGRMVLRAMSQTWKIEWPQEFVERAGVIEPAMQKFLHDDNSQIQRR